MSVKICYTAGMSLLFMLVFAHAAPVKPCEALLHARTIPRTEQKVYPIEMAAAGQIVAATDYLPRLETGFYIYLITRSGEILYSPKYDLHETSKNLATHKSLLEMYRRKTGKSAEASIVAGGEFQIAFDEVAEIRNKSGNFRGDDATLELAVEVLTAHGLPIGEYIKKTAVRPDVSEDEGHTPRDRDVDGFRIQVLKEVGNSARGRALRDAYIRFHALLRETYPSLNGPSLIAKLMNAQSAGARQTGNYDGYQTFYFPLQTAYARDGFAYGIWSVETQADRSGADGFGRGGPKQFENFLIGASADLNGPLREKWKSLEAAFLALEALKN